MWLLQDNPAPSHMTIDNFMKDYLVNCIDGTKITANVNKYSWVWKKGSVKNRDKVFNKITELLNEINKVTSM